MIENELSGLILVSMKNHNETRTNALRAIKAAILNWKTAKENVGKEYNEAAEVNLIKKLVKMREDSAQMYKDAHREDLAEAELNEMKVLKEFLPAEVTEEQIEFVVENITLSGAIEPVKKNMGAIIKAVKETLPTADGKLVATVVQRHLN